MHKEIILWGITETEKCKCHHHQSLVLLENVDIDNIQVSSMVSPI